jgi:hypothetical protein
VAHGTNRWRPGQAHLRRTPDRSALASQALEVDRQSYSKAPFFRSFRATLEEFYLGERWDHLSDLNQHLIMMISREMLGIRSEFC